MTVTFLLITFLPSPPCQMLAVRLSCTPSFTLLISRHELSHSPPCSVCLFELRLLLSLLSSVSGSEENGLLQSQQLQMYHEGWEWSDQSEGYGGRGGFPGTSEARVDGERG